MFAVPHPLSPMLGALAHDLPEGEDWRFEPKWDGFRAIVYRHADDLDIRSRDGKPLLRYFPELADPLKATLPDSAVVDGEIVMIRGGQLDFEGLQMRLHPAASRVKMLADTVPAAMVLWDLLADGDQSLLDEPYDLRRHRLEQRVTATATVRLTPATTDRTRALDWFARFEGAGLDGVMAKRGSDAYQPGKRGFVKVKHVKTIDCVVAGFRWHKNAKNVEVGSLVLALYDDVGQLHPIGVASSFSKAERVRLTGVLAPLADPADHPWASWGQHRPDVRSRWAANRDLRFVSVALAHVVEVSTTQSSPRRLRHPGKVVRWRQDRLPESCRLDQLAVAAPAELSALFAR